MHAACLLQPGLSYVAFGFRVGAAAAACVLQPGLFLCMALPILGWGPTRAAGKWIIGHSQ